MLEWVSQEQLEPLNLRTVWCVAYNDNQWDTEE